MKTQVTKKQVLDYFGKNRVLSFGYCAIQGLENYLPELSKSTHYTRGVYGWNADVYCIEGGCKFFAVCTGYRPFGVYDEKLSEIAGKYEKKISLANWDEKGEIASEFLDTLESYLQEKEISK